MMIRWLLLLLCLGLSGCIDMLEPNVGPALRELCVNEDSDPETDISFRRDIAEGIFHRDGVACLDCHAKDAPTPLGFEVGGLDLSSVSSLRAGGVVSGDEIVIPGQACQSILLQKVVDGPPFGARMPLSGPPFLSADEQQTIHDWIMEGARDN